MAVRASMAALISKTRLLIGDPAGGSQQFADQDIQDVLDIGRFNVTNALLRPVVTLTTSGVLNYTDYFADQGDWESDVVLQKGAFTILSDMASSDYLTGHWTWSLPNPGKVPPIFITGKYYDTYLAAAQLLERWAAVWLRSYDFSADGQSFHRSQAAAQLITLAKQYRRLALPIQLITLAKQYRRLALPRTARLIRSDMSDDSTSTNVVVGNTDVMGW